MTDGPSASRLRWSAMADDVPRARITDPYAVLGVPHDADHATVRAAYVRIMRQYHPDLRPHDPAAAHVVREANAAWEVLRHPQRRAAYDRAQRRTDAGTGGSAEAVATGRRSAYSSEKDAYRAAVTRATTRVGVAVFTFGLVLLIVATGLR